MIHLYKEYRGFATYLILESDNLTELTEQYYSLWNWRATSGGLIWLNYPKLGYIITTEHKLLNALIQASLAEILNREPNKHKGFKGSGNGSMPEARLMGTQKFNEIKEKEFYWHSEKDKELNCYKMGEIEAHAPNYLIKRRTDKTEFYMP